MNDFWAGKRVFLTGHTGFKGSWLALWLQHLGARVTGYALAPPNENREWIWGYRENDRLGGRDPYGSSKACAELVASAFRESFFQPSSHLDRVVALATARAGNVIGGGDWAKDRLIPDILRAIAAGEVVEIRSPTAIRPWQHVLEPLSGYLALAERLFTDGVAFSDAWNFGPAEADGHSVAWIADHLTGMWSPKARWAVTNAPQPHEDHYLRLDSAKAGQKLGWRTRWDLSTALTRIVSWHKAWLAGDKHCRFHRHPTRSREGCAMDFVRLRICVAVSRFRLRCPEHRRAGRRGSFTLSRIYMAAVNCTKYGMMPNDAVFSTLTGLRPLAEVPC
ncbi:NAD-dependent epimerase/dehydratase family protein [Bradyrhizobium sp. USDA 4518]